MPGTPRREAAGAGVAAAELPARKVKAGAQNRGEGGQGGQGGKGVGGAVLWAASWPREERRSASAGGASRCSRLPRFRPELLQNEEALGGGGAVAGWLAAVVESQASMAWRSATLGSACDGVIARFVVGSVPCSAAQRTRAERS